MSGGKTKQNGTALHTGEEIQHLPDEKAGDFSNTEKDSVNFRAGIESTSRMLQNILTVLRDSHREVSERLAQIESRITNLESSGSTIDAQIDADATSPLDDEERLIDIPLANQPEIPEDIPGKRKGISKAGARDRQGHEKR